MIVHLPYEPHGKQVEIHADPTRFKVIAAGRRGGKTVMLVNEFIKQALDHPQEPGGPVQRSWYVSTTYRQSEMVAWRTCLRFLPAKLIKKQNIHKLQIELVNGHLMEFKGSEDPDKLRGVSLVWVGVDEYGLMKPEVWTEVLRPMLVDTQGGAMFIGTPGADGSPHFHDLWLQGQDGRDPAYKSWLFFTTDNPHIPKDEILEAKRNLPPDIYKREFEADFSSTAGLIYDNFKHGLHVIPHYEPTRDEFIVGSIDPGLQNPTAATLCAWNRAGEGRIFKEYYEKNKLATENAEAMKKWAEPYRVAYWVIDRSSKKRDMTSGLTVYQKFADHLRPLLTAPNDPGSVWAGIDEVKKLFQPNPLNGRPRLYIANQCHWTLWELGRYTRYKRRWHVDRNEEEKPRKLNDHLMDCMRNMVMTQPWRRPSIQIHQPTAYGY